MVDPHLLVQVKRGCLTVTILLFTSFRYFVHECYASKWMKSTAMIRSLLDPVCWVKVRVLNIRKLNVRYGCVFAFEAVLIIMISNLLWLEGC